MDLSLDNVVTITGVPAGRGFGVFNVNNMAIITHEENSIDGDFQIVTSPMELSGKFESDSITLKKVNTIFSQNKSIKNGNGYLAVIPMLHAEYGLELSDTPASGSYDLIIGGSNTVTIDWDDDINAIRVKLEAIDSRILVTGADSNEYAIKFIYENDHTVTIDNVTLQDATPDPITVTLLKTGTGESPSQALTRAMTLVEFFGVEFTFEETPQEFENIASIVQPTSAKKMFFSVTSDTDALEENGHFKLNSDRGNTKTRCLFNQNDFEERQIFKSAYASRLLSTNFSVSESASTMHLKDLVGVIADKNIDQTLLKEIQDAGADCYISIEGVPKTYTSGVNRFVDQVYHETAISNDFQVAYANVLSTTQTKIAQTETGVSKLTNALSKVCDKYVRNGYIASGEWTRPDTFGNVDDFKRNIRDFGYFIFTESLALQDSVERKNRVAPVAQIAIKEAGAIHKGQIIFQINE